MKLEIIDLQKLYHIDKNKIKNLVKSILKAEGKDAELNIVFTDNKRIKEMNKTFLGHNYATDVLSFVYNESSFTTNRTRLNRSQITITGEIIISVEMATELAHKLGYTIEGEIALYLVHGLLHLLGYNDRQQREAKKMHQREGELLSNLGYSVPIPD